MWSMHNTVWGKPNYEHHVLTERTLSGTIIATVTKRSANKVQSQLKVKINTQLCPHSHAHYLFPDCLPYQLILIQLRRPSYDFIFMKTVRSSGFLQRIKAFAYSGDVSKMPSSCKVSMTRVICSVAGTQVCCNDLMVSEISRTHSSMLWADLLRGLSTSCSRIRLDRKSVV